MIFANNYRIEYALKGLSGLSEYHREDGPAVEHLNGDKYWIFHGSFHRKDGPAIIGASGIKEWYKNGFRHRVGGPAIEYPDGKEEYWINGKLI